MKKILLLINLISVNILFSQNIQHLDTKYGLNIFKLESSINLYKPYLTPLFNGEGKVKYYSYDKGDIKTIFDYEIEKISLGYYKDKLYYISIQFENTDWFNKDIVYMKLKSLFGEGVYKYDYNMGPLYYDWGYTWSTKKTYLSFDKAKTKNAPTIWMQSLIIDMQITNDEF